MASSSSPPSSKTDSINVFITGFGPFPKFDGHGGQHTLNASHELTKLLPCTLLPHHPANPTSRHIELINPTAAQDAYLKTEYAYIRTFISEMHDRCADDIDLFLHIGMGGAGQVAVERRAYKQGFSSEWSGSGGSASKGDKKKQYYMREDAAGKNVLDAPPCPWDASVPVGLCTDVDVDAVVNRANMSLCKNEDIERDREGGGGGHHRHHGSEYLPVKPHHEAGDYACGFTFYESLANKYVKGSRASVMFCHIPGDTDEQSLERAKNSIVAVIGAAVEDILKARKGSEGSSSGVFVAKDSVSTSSISNTASEVSAATQQWLQGGWV